MPPNPMKSTTTIQIQKYTASESLNVEDTLAIEEPLEIRLAYGSQGQEQSISITMRTPGHDQELAAGFLFTEGIIQQASQIQAIAHIKSLNPAEQGNIIRVQLAETTNVNLKKLERHFYTSSSCGVCGKASIDAVRTTSAYSLLAGQPQFSAQLIHQLPERLRLQQAVFDHTGGLHAAALFDTTGKLLLLREDVGRHNAVDKLIGAALSEGLVPLQDRLILVSGRASFELIQKALMAGIPMLAAIGAPSSLAVELAQEAGMSVLGFVRDGRFNVYCGGERVL